VAVLVEKRPIKEASNGKPFSLWKVSDLDSATVTLFLFGDAHQQHWREPPGTLLALFHAKVAAPILPSSSTPAERLLTFPKAFCIQRAAWLKAGPRLTNRAAALA
jgi:hypothetical protein